MCSCTTHSWLARPVNPRDGDQALAGHAGDRADAVGAALAGALAVYDRRARGDDHSALLLEVSVDSDVIGWLPFTPTDGKRPDRYAVIDRLCHLHGTICGLDWPTGIPELPADALRVDLDPAFDQDTWVGDLTPGTPGPTPMS